jgi:hypothetical protein
MKITREQLRSIVGEVLQEEKDYQSFFQAMLKKHGVSSPDEFKSDEEKKAFFNKVEDTWKGVSERLIQLKEDELTAKQQKIDLNKNGKVDGDDLSKLRAGSQTEGEVEEPTSLTKILSKEGETLVKSGAGKMYNITKVNEGVSPKDMDVIKSAVEAASSFMGVGSELKKLGIKYTFATEPLAIYIVQPTPNNKVAIVNKRYATKPDFVVGDIAVGIMEGKLKLNK